MDGVFVTGTDTGVGKTVVCAGLMKLLHGSKPATYWKPIQTGTIVGDDTNEVKKLTGYSEECFGEPAFRFPEPLPPYLAAEKWGKNIEVSDIVRQYQTNFKNRFMIVEGAGGLLLPLSNTELLKDLILQLKLPIILVSEDRVGAINQILLTLNACTDFNIPVLGVIMTRCRKTLGNSSAVTRFGKTKVLAELDPSEDIRNTIAQVGADSGLRQLFNVNNLPA